MNRARAFEILGIVGNPETKLSEEQIRERFAATVKANHPDTLTTDALARIVWSMESIKDARNYLLETLGGNPDSACKLCKGVGMVRATIGWLKCSACKGTGEKR